MTEEYRKQLGQLTQLRIRSHSFMLTILKVVEILGRLEHLGDVGFMQHLHAAGRVDWSTGGLWETGGQCSSELLMDIGRY